MLPASDRNQSNAFHILPALQPGTNIPQVLRLLLRERGNLYTDRIVSWSVERDAGRDNRISILDEHAFSARENGANLSILLGQIFEIVHDEWLGGKFIDFCVVLRIKRDCTIGFM